jgi:hypothetical protein
VLDAHGRTNYLCGRKAARPVPESGPSQWAGRISRNL